MSDFSAAILIKSEHKAVALEHMEDDVLLIRLNDKWICRLSADADADVSMVSIAMDLVQYSKTLLDLSECIPLIHINHAEDHCLEVCILHKSKSVCKFGVSYEFGFDEIELDDDAEFADMMNYSHFIKEEFEQFKLFGFDGKTCDEIFTIFSDADMNDFDEKHEAVAQFFSILGIEEFSFVSHHYASIDKEQGVTHFDIIKG